MLRDCSYRRAGKLLFIRGTALSLRRVVAGAGVGLRVVGLLVGGVAVGGLGVGGVAAVSLPVGGLPVGGVFLIAPVLYEGFREPERIVRIKNVNCNTYMIIKYEKCGGEF